MFAFLLKNRAEKKDREELAQRLYDAVIEQARNPVFYNVYGVPDTIDGRFDVTCLHSFLVVERLYKEGVAGEKLAQSLFDTMFRDMDCVLREIGIGDLGVPKHMKRMMKGFKGRAISYRSALQSGEDNALEDVLARNLYGSIRHPSADKVRMAAGYIKNAVSAMDKQPFEDMCCGKIDFGVLNLSDENENSRKTDVKSRMVA